MSDISTSDISMVERQECSGCGACANACPQECIHLEAGPEGFWEPVIDRNRCMQCGCCLDVCPVARETNRNSCHENEEARIYAAWSKSKAVSRDSSSGGIFPLLAKEVVRRGGVVVGAAFQEDMTVKHVVVDKPDGIRKLQGSKYIQSRIDNTYLLAEQILKEGRFVLFSGLPCQIAGLNSYLRHNNPHLFKTLVTCQLVCYGVPSVEVFLEYLRYLERIYGAEIASYRFRSKLLGWESYGVQATFKNGGQYEAIGSKDPFVIGFLRALYLRSSCYSCKFKGFPIDADIALGDFWNVNKHDEELAGRKGGISLVVAQTAKGNDLFVSIRDSIECKQQTVEMAVRCNQSLVTCPRLSAERKKFLDDYRKHGYVHAMRKYSMPFNLMKRGGRYVKRWLRAIIVRWLTL